jgi:hypothetical protein
MAMLKRILLLLVFVALSMAVCNAQQYFTGTVLYKFSLPPDIEPDTQRILVEYATHYIKVIPLHTGKPLKKTDTEAVIDWTENCLYTVTHNEKRVLKKYIKRSSLKIALQKEFPDSVCNWAGVKGRLQKYIIAKDNIPVDCWLADSILLPQRDLLQTNSDFFFFCRDRLMLKMEIKHISDTLEAASMFSEISVIAENITPLPSNDLRYQIPADYKIIDEDEQQRISDSLMREFKTVDSALMTYPRSKGLDSLEMLVNRMDSLQKLKRQVEVKLRKLNSRGKKKKDKPKQAARKP